MANYCFDLVKEYSSFYQQSPVLKEENEDLRGMRLELAVQTGNTVKDCMEMLGIDMPEHM